MERGLASRVKKQFGSTRSLAPLQELTRLYDCRLLNNSDNDEVCSDQALALQASLAAVLFFSSSKGTRIEDRESRRTSLQLEEIAVAMSAIAAEIASARSPGNGLDNNRRIEGDRWSSSCGLSAAEVPSPR